MATTTSRGLSPDDLEQIRDTLAAGRKPKVTFTDAAGQVAGQVGQVIELTDPQLSDEWVVVRFGRDELPFSPADLAIPVRNGRKPAAAAEPKAEPEFVLDVPRKDVPPKPDKSRAVPAPREEVPVPSSTVEAPAKPVNGSDPAPAVKKAVKAAKPKAPASLTVTLAYAEGEWTVAASKGEKALAKPYVIRPSEALRMVSLLDVPAVHDAVEHILSAERAQAEEQAQRLRTELADIEARLAELRAAE